VVCIDIDRSKLQMLANNASIYGVHPSKLLLLLGDARKIMKDCYKNGKLTFRSDNDLQADSEVANEELPSSTQICQLTTNSDEKGKPTENDALYPIRGMESLPLSIHAIFLSPPWGGPTYIYNTSNKKIKMAVKPSLSLQEDMTDAITLLRRTGIELEQNLINGKLKTVTAYIGMSKFKA